MNGKYLLDTNIVIALWTNDEAVLSQLKSNMTVFLSSIVLGELVFGAYASARTGENLGRVFEFAANNTVLAWDSATASYYRRVKSRLREAGRPIPENDVSPATPILMGFRS